MLTTGGTSAHSKYDILTRSSREFVDFSPRYRPERSAVASGAESTHTVHVQSEFLGVRSSTIHAFESFAGMNAKMTV